MENKNKLNLKVKPGLIKTTTTKPRTPDANMESEIFRRSTSTPRSPPTRKPESRIDPGCIEQRTLAMEMTGIDREFSMEENPVLIDISKERSALEEFLFNENNKISKSAIKFILSKWSFLESKLYEDRLEVEKLKATYLNGGPSKTYAQMLSCPASQAAPAMKPATEKKIIRSEHEVVLIRPIEEKDKRNNEQLKQDLVKELEGLRNKLKVKGIRQMRNKGIIVEVKDRRDVDLIKRTDLKKIGLRTGEPNKLNPSLIVYDVESDHKPEDLKEDLLNKNFENMDESLIDELKKDIYFKFRIKASENKVHWVIQLPGPLFRNLVNNSRIYMMWRSYKIKEYLSIMRCFKCHGFGHIAKNCESSDQLCEICGSKDHLKAACTKGGSPSCLNCVRNKRKDTNHSVRSALCPEYKRHVEIYRHKIKWD